MDLTTRCPDCGSTFSASLAQLQLRKGFIRCPRCAHIFDGYEAVVPAGAGAQATAAADVPSVVRQRVTKDTDPATLPMAPGAFTARSAATPPPASGPEPDPFTISSIDVIRRPARAEPRLNATAVHGEPRLNASPPADRYDEPRMPADRRGATSALADRHGAAPAPAVALIPDFLNSDSPPRSRLARLLWGVLILVGLVVLLAQAVYVYRVQIASQVPSVRPLLEHACAALDCKVPYSRHIQLISIMRSSLQADTRTPSSEADGRYDQMTLYVTLRNNDTYDQEWPTLTLDLVDFSGTVVVRKDLPPDAYLSADALKGPFEAKSEVSVTVPITLNNIKINGFEIGKFFP